MILTYRLLIVILRDKTVGGGGVKRRTKSGVASQMQCLKQESIISCVKYCTSSKWRMWQCRADGDLDESSFGGMMG